MYNSYEILSYGASLTHAKQWPFRVFVFFNLLFQFDSYGGTKARKYKSAKKLYESEMRRLKEWKYESAKAQKCKSAKMALMGLQRK